MEYSVKTIFLSYARQDLNIVQQVYITLRDKYHLNVWFDLERIAPSENWAAEIKRGLTECDTVILIASEFSMASPYVADEWLYAASLAKPIYVWQITDCDIHPSLSGVPCSDLRADPLDPERWSEALTSIKTQRFIDCAKTNWQKRIVPSYVSFYLKRFTMLQALWSVVVIALAAQSRLPLGLLTVPFALFLFDHWLVYRHLNSIRIRRMQHLLLQSSFAQSIVLKLFIIIGIFPRINSLLLPVILLAAIMSVGFLLGNFNYDYVNVRRQGLPQFQKSKLRGWLPAYPTGSFKRNLFDIKESFFKSLFAESTISKKVHRIAITYAEYDAHFANYLTAQLKQQSSRFEWSIVDYALPAPYQSELVGLRIDAVILVVTPHALPLMKEWIIQQALEQLLIVPLLLQNTANIPDSISRLQWVDARTDYEDAVTHTIQILNGDSQAEMGLDLPKRTSGGLASIIAFPPGVSAVLMLVIGMMLVIPIPLIFSPMLFSSAYISATQTLIQRFIHNLPFEGISIGFSIFITYQAYMAYLERRWTIPLILWLYSFNLIVICASYRVWINSFPISTATLQARLSSPPGPWILLGMLFLPLLIAPILLISRRTRRYMARSMQLYEMIFHFIQVRRVEPASQIRNVDTFADALELWKPKKPFEKDVFLIFAALTAVVIFLVLIGPAK